MQTCSSCGGFVPNGMTHMCPGIPVSTTKSRLSDDDVERIARRVVELLRDKERRALARS